MLYLRATLLSVLLLTAHAHAGRQDTLTLPEKVSIATSASRPAVPVRDSIILAATQNGWFVQGDAPGKMELRFNKGNKHELVVAVRYDANGYQIQYVSSVNLNYDNSTGIERIHPNANRWIANLNQGINRATGQLASVGLTATPQNASATAQ